MVDPNRDLLIVRRPFRDRRNPLSSDVAEAIHRRVGTETALPVALTKLNVVHELIVLHHEMDDGTAMPVSPGARAALEEAWYNRLSNTAVFQAGYKHYEGLDAYGNFPVVPVTDYFFKIVYAGGQAEQILADMSDFEVMQSLPKRTGRVPVEGEDGEYMRDENGDIAKFGTLAGIVVFPPNSHAPLLRAWLQRQGNVTLGQNRKIVNAIGHARPDAAAVEVLKEKVGEIRPAITKALPRPRRT